MRDVQKMAEDLRGKMVEVQKLNKKIPAYVAGAAERMKDANFSAQGFVENGTARPRWKNRKQETGRTRGKRILHGTGTLQNSVKVKALTDKVTVGVDLSTVPYAKVHNDGGRVIQYVRAHTRKHWKTGKRYQVRGFSRKLSMPQRRFLGYSPDIFKSAEKDVRREFDKIFNN